MQLIFAVKRRWEVQFPEMILNGPTQNSHMQQGEKRYWVRFWHGQFYAELRPSC